MQAPQLSRRDKIYRVAGKFTIGILSLCLILGTVTFSLGWFFSSRDDYHINFYPSPSGHMRAAHISRSGGGGISPYCTEAIAVAPASADEADIRTEKFEVYSSSDCDTFADHSPSPTLEWISNEKLRISFSLNRTAASMRTVQLRGRDLSRRVGIEFAARQ
jgi:hypothetical protein